MKQLLIPVLFMLPFFGFGFSASGQEAMPPPNHDSHAETPKKELLIPNAFTPNNDGQNDYFKIINFTDQKLIEFKVFNRWGTILFQTKDPKEGWNGKFKDHMQPLGVYGYVIRIAYPESEVIETYKGTVTLLR